ncbi:MAG: hypothetical protein N4A62_14200 [Marinisporobacter sp.]|jgi:hypothetical protein|nr:hypothetical protein [Marinisporobacter sp.]
MKKNNDSVKRIKNMNPCGVITCIHCVAGLCNNCKECDFYERRLIQED